MNQTLDASNQEACLPRFRAEMADKEIACLRYELKRSRRCEGELTAKEIRRAYRRGKKEMVEVMKTHRAQFLCEFGEVKESYQALADYRECRGSVGGLYFTQIPDYSFAAEDAKQTRRMKVKEIWISRFPRSRRGFGISGSRFPYLLTRWKVRREPLMRRVK